MQKSDEVFQLLIRNVLLQYLLSEALGRPLAGVLCCIQLPGFTADPFPASFPS